MLVVLFAAAVARGDAPNSPEAKPLASSTRPSTKAAEGAPLGKSEPKLTSTSIQTLASLAGVVALIVVLGVTVRMVSRRSGGLMAALGAGGRAPSGLLEVLGRYPVGRGSTLILLKMDRRVLLISQGGGGKLGGASMNTLCEVTDPEDVASILLKTRDEEGDTLARKFQGLLRGAERAATASFDDEPAAEPFKLGPDTFDLAKARAAKGPPVRPAQDAPATPIRARLNTMRAPMRPAAGGAR